MSKKTQMSIVAVAAMAAWCGPTMASDSTSGLVNIPLSAARQNAGKIAQATLVPLDGATEIALVVSGVPSNVSQPPHLYTYIYRGACGSLEQQPAIEMNQHVVLGARVPQQASLMWKTAPIAMSELRSGDYALVVRTSAADGAVDIFCGNLKQAA